MGVGPLHAVAHVKFETEDILEINIQLVHVHEIGYLVRLAHDSNQDLHNVIMMGISLV